MSAGGAPGSRGGPLRNAATRSFGARYRCADRPQPRPHHGDAPAPCADRGFAAGRRDADAA